MPSPIEQAKRQANFLKKYLGKSNLKPAQNVIESLFRNATYEDINVDVLVAISDTGIISRPKNTSDDKIYKADMITGKIKELIRYYKDNDSLFNFDSKSAPMTIYAEDRKKIAEYLTKNHNPLMVKSQRVVSSSLTPAIRKFNCLACGNTDLIILYGKFGYYFECNKCHKTNSIKEKCEKCGKQLKPHKDGNHFYIKCDDCGTSKLFFTNPTL
jgi:DNA-directed RNA polymerase subunit RPC12/RpoP